MELRQLLRKFPRCRTPTPPSPTCPGSIISERWLLGADFLRPVPGELLAMRFCSAKGGGGLTLAK